MRTQVRFLDCPEYMSGRGRVRCALPAAVEYEYGARSTDGTLDSVKIRCPRGHWFNGTVESLTWAEVGEQVTVGPAAGSGGAPPAVSW